MTTCQFSQTAREQSESSCQFSYYLIISIDQISLLIFDSAIKISSRSNPTSFESSFLGLDYKILTLLILLMFHSCENLSHKLREKVVLPYASNLKNYLNKLQQMQRAQSTEKSEKKREKKEKKHRQRSRSRSRQKQRSKKDSYKEVLVPYEKQYRDNEQMLPEKTHVSCRRCKKITFSLKTRTCSSCGYPKEQRPAYFPVPKQVQVLDMVRQGKLVHNSYAPVVIEVIVNDRMGKRQRIKCCPSDTILQLKKLVSAQIGTRAAKIRLQKANVIFKDHITLQDYEIKDGSGIDMYYD